MASKTWSGCSRQLVPKTPADRAAAAANLPFSCMGMLSLAILPNLLQAVDHLAMAAACSAGPAPWMTRTSAAAAEEVASATAAAAARV